MEHFYELVATIQALCILAICGCAAVDVSTGENRFGGFAEILLVVTVATALATFIVPMIGAVL